jgi:hypothetical protein
MMPGIMRYALCGFLLSVFLFTGPGPAFAQADSLYETLTRRSEVKVFVWPPSDVSEKKGLDPAVLKEALEKSFSGRKSIHFRTVASASEAELALETQINGFLFSETDPVDMLIGVGAAALDAATQDHFASAEALFTVRDLKSGAVLWKDKVNASVTDHTMTEAESRQKVVDRLAEMLMRTAFGKKKK